MAAPPARGFPHGVQRTAGRRSVRYRERPHSKPVRSPRSDGSPPAAANAHPPGSWLPASDADRRAAGARHRRHGAKPAPGRRCQGCNFLWPRDETEPNRPATDHAARPIGHRTGIAAQARGARAGAAQERRARRTQHGWASHLLPQDPAPLVGDRNAGAGPSTDPAASFAGKHAAPAILIRPVTRMTQPVEQRGRPPPSLPVVVAFPVRRSRRIAGDQGACRCFRTHAPHDLPACRCPVFRRQRTQGWSPPQSGSREQAPLPVQSAWHAAGETRE